MAEGNKGKLTELENIVINEELLKRKMYEFRGKKVMLDADLAEIYGYETKNLKKQVKNNISKFQGEDFMFELTAEEVEILSRCKNFTLNKNDGVGRGTNIKYKPYVFTEQGIYMLMTVLRGDLAVKQSRALIRTFKKMKDYIIDNQNLIGQRDYLLLSMQTAENKAEIDKLQTSIGTVEKRLSDVMGRLNNVITKSDLADTLTSFVNNTDNGWLIYNTNYCTADVAYSSIYEQAQKSIYVVDNYIGIRTLVMLKNAPAKTEIRIFSDNLGSRKLHKIEFDDFCKEYPENRIVIQHTDGIYHDRFIVLDYGTENQRVFLCGASSKDAGARITCIVEDYGIRKYDEIIKGLLKNDRVILP